MLREREVYQRGGEGDLIDKQLVGDEYGINKN
jgi:hypothetical protein